MNIKNSILIFDFDGTIADTFQNILNISNRLASEFKFKRIEPHEKEEMKDKTSKEVTKLLEVPLMKIPAIVAKAKKELHKEMNDVKPTEGFEETLIELKKWCKSIGILTSNSSENVLKFLESHNLDIFDFITTTSKIWSKNTGLKKLMKKHEFDSKDVLYVGDETRDIEAAKKVGIKVIAVSWGYNSSKALAKHKPDYLIHNPKELLGLFKNISA